MPLLHLWSANTTRLLLLEFGGTDCLFSHIREAQINRASTGEPLLADLLADDYQRRLNDQSLRQERAGGVPRSILQGVQKSMSLNRSD
jgi:hypothetical protein